MTDSIAQVLALALARELRAFRSAAAASDAAIAWRALERAHILSQPHLRAHLAVHRAMLGYAWRRREAHEVLGQLLRLMLVPLGSLTGRIRRGNTGRSNVSAFAEAPVPADLAPLLARDEQRRG